MGSSVEALLVLLLKEEPMLGLVLMELLELRDVTLLCLGVCIGLTVGSLLLAPELSSEFSSILVSLDVAVFRKLLTASLLFMGGFLARSLS